MKKAILFDLDGTLTDSGEGIINCAVYTFEQFGLPVPSREALRVIVGPPLRESLIRFGIPEDQVEEGIRVYRSRYIPIGKFENEPYPGIRELLEKLLADGHKLYVATSKPEATAIEILQHFDLAKYFVRICGASSDLIRNTKAQVIEYLLELNGNTENAVMVGDTAFDVLGAKAHGIPTIGVSWGYGENQDMVDAGAIGIAETMDDLYEMLSK